jgi:molecular chaperone GrpE
MTEPASGIGDVAARFDEVLKEVRRQGRAAIAAQAAAESCLALLGERNDTTSDRTALQWLRALLPIADALDRIVAQAGASGTAPPASLFARLFGARASPDARALAESVRVLRAQLRGVFQELAVAVDEPLHEAFDARVHRAVEARALCAGERAGTVLEVVRPGYRLQGKLVREADVVVGKESSAQ